MTQTPRGYEPADTVLYAGMPTTWVIDGTSQFDCSAFLRVPDLGLQVDLKQGLNTVELPALDRGTVPFTCVMGMYSGNLVVVDPPAALGHGGHRALSRRGGQVVEAAWMAAIEASRAASNSSSAIAADSPSVSAREKLAITPGLRASRSSASSRV